MSITLSLTVLTFVLALVLTDRIDLSAVTNPVYNDVAEDPLSNSGIHLVQLLGFWYKGLWNSEMLAFAIQMMLILVLGYILASTAIFRKIIGKVLVYCTSTASAAFLVTLLTLAVSFVNWGIGLVFGAIFARKAAEYAREKNISFNYPLIAAAGYSGMMVWHGGFSASAPLKVAETGHLKALAGLDLLPIDIGQTLLSPMNITVGLLLLVILPLAMFFIGRRSGTADQIPLKADFPQEKEEKFLIKGADRIDHSRLAGTGTGLLLIAIAASKAAATGNLSVIDLNFVNFVLMGLAFVFSGSIARFIDRARDATGAASGILIQFPLYFGIMGIMKYSGLVEVLSGYLVSISNESTFPVFAFISAGIVNIFIPSGGGQWIVQGPIIVEAAQSLGVPLSKSVMAFAYGDQVTNMLQPFWAIPLLGITGLKAKDIIPYTLFLMVIGVAIFMVGLILF